MVFVTTTIPAPAVFDRFFLATVWLSMSDRYILVTAVALTSTKRQLVLRHTCSSDVCKRQSFVTFIDPTSTNVSSSSHFQLWRLQTCSSSRLQLWCLQMHVGPLSHSKSWRLQIAFISPSRLLQLRLYNQVVLRLICNSDFTTTNWFFVSFTTSILQLVSFTNPTLQPLIDSLSPLQLRLYNLSHLQLRLYNH